MPILGILFDTDFLKTCGLDWVNRGGVKEEIDLSEEMAKRLFLSKEDIQLTNGEFSKGVARRFGILQNGDQKNQRPLPETISAIAQRSIGRLEATIDSETDSDTLTASVFVKLRQIGEMDPFIDIRVVLRLCKIQSAVSLFRNYRTGMTQEKSMGSIMPPGEIFREYLLGKVENDWDWFKENVQKGSESPGKESWRRNILQLSCKTLESMPLRYNGDVVSDFENYKTKVQLEPLQFACQFIHTKNEKFLDQLLNCSLVFPERSSR